MTTPKESIHPLIASTRIGMDNQTTENLCLSINVFSIKHVIALELRSSKDLSKLELKWMPTRKEKTFVDVAEIWKQHKFELSSCMTPS
jgi:hypothetical protein